MIEAGFLGIDPAKIMQLPENMVGDTKPVVLVQESAAAGLQADHQMNNIRCPRCDSPNTKFCYYNNYNLTQPRHFCKSCRRYWTKGGALRNVPFGGGCRKNKNSNTTSTTRNCSNKQTMSKSPDISYSSTATNYHIISTGTSPNINTSHDDHQPNSSSGSMSAIPLQLPAINYSQLPPVPNSQIISYLDHQYYSLGAGVGAGGGYLPFLLAAAGNVNLQSKNVESNHSVGNYGAWRSSSSAAAAAAAGLFGINNNNEVIRNYNLQNVINGKVLFNNIIPSNELLEDQSAGEQQQQQKMPPPTLLFPLIPAAAHGSSSSSWGSSISTGCYVEMSAAYQAAAASNSNMQVHVRDAAMPAVVPVTGEMGFWSAPLAWSDVQATTTCCTTTSTGAAASSSL